MPEDRLSWLGMHQTEHERPREAPETGGEQVAEDKLSYEPVKVQTISEPVEKVNCYTVVLSATNPVLPLLPVDPEREDAAILAVDNPVVIAQSYEQAANPANTVANVPQPIGTYIPVGVRWPVKATGATWVGLTTTATNSRVSVMVFKR
jgi:hypothetical protein